MFIRSIVFIFGEMIFSQVILGRQLRWILVFD